MISYFYHRFHIVLRHICSYHFFFHISFIISIYFVSIFVSKCYYILTFCWFYCHAILSYKTFFYYVWLSSNLRWLWMVWNRCKAAAPLQLWQSPSSVEQKRPKAELALSKTRTEKLEFHILPQTKPCFIKWSFCCVDPTSKVWVLYR